MKYATLLALVALPTLSLQAQETPQHETFRKNNLKFSATNLFFKNFDLQYERILNKNWSLAYAVRIQPLGNFPGQSTLKRDVSTGNENSDFNHETFRTGSISLTPEVRYYTGKGYGKGFYIGAFARYSNFRSDDFTLYYTQPSGTVLPIPLEGQFNTYSGGLIFGKQFTLTNRLTLDCFLGGHFGQAIGEINANYPALSVSDQQAVQDILDNIQLKHLSEKALTTEVGNTSTHIGIDGFWAAYRGGINLAFWF